jgi:transposase
MSRGKRYPAEMRERAVRLVFEQQEQYPSQGAAICSVAEKLGIGTEAVPARVNESRWHRGCGSGFAKLNAMAASAPG